MVNFTPRSVGIHRPLPGEAPWPDADPDGARVAKLDGAIVGAYQIERLAPTAFVIVALCVVEDCRGRGLGGWLLGHAIGTAESQGARRIEARPPHAFYVRHGFAWHGGRFVLVLTPE